MAEYREILNEEQENQIINEEYKIWKKNSPYLYDLVITHELEFPSLSIQWLPVKDCPMDKDYSIHKCILGTTGSENEVNNLLIAKVRVPKEESMMDCNNDGNIQQNQENRIEIETKIIHEGDVNKCRYCPQKYNVIACHGLNGQINIFDYSKHPTQPKEQEMKPQLILKGHSQEGFGLCWSMQQEGLLASSSNDTTIKIWDIEQAKELNGQMEAILTIKEHKEECNDVQFIKNSPHLLLSCSDDKTINLYDLRANAKLQLSVQAHQSDIYSLDTNPFDDKAFISGSGDNSIKLWDMRNLKQKIHSFENHQDEVTRVEYSPFNGAIFGSSSKDRRINIWDISKCGMDMKAEDIQDGPPELLFVHGGHKSYVDDFSWDQNNEFLICSVEQQYSLCQVWQMASILYLEDDEPN